MANYILPDKQPYYTMADVDDFLAYTLPYKQPDDVPMAYKKQGRQSIGYCDIVAGLDTEATSIMVRAGLKSAYMYIWMFGISGQVILGRTWSELHILMAKIACKLWLSAPCDGWSGRTLPVYVHNLAYDFQFFRQFWAWDNVFALDTHKPVRARCLEGYEYRCSLVLSGLALKQMEPRSIAVKKRVGDLDYTKIRHSGTPLTDDEIGYCVDDVKVMMGYVADKLVDNGDNLATIPMTRTGYVRRDVRTRCYKDKNYRDLIKSLTLTLDQYDRMKQLFQGGYTHANAMYQGITLHDMQSIDITSSYPTVMVAEEYPMSKFRPYTPRDYKDFLNCLQKYACIFRLKIWGLRPRLEQDNPISKSKCLTINGDVINNGRVYSADYLEIECNEIDFDIYSKFYQWDKIEYSDLERAVKGYLPKPLIESILYYYAQKTTLKNVPGEEVTYARYKEFVNAIYGMMVTDIIKPTHLFDRANQWMTNDDDDRELAMKKNNKSKNRFLYYPWGVWVTSYARRNLFRMVEEFGNDYVYSDTDSGKVMNFNDHKQWVVDYNREIVAKIVAVCNHYGIDPALAQPKNKDGDVCPLGVWDDDGTYTRFKTLGAKRYLVETPDKKGNLVIKSTVAGLNKKGLPEYLKSLGGDPFDSFVTDMTVPAKYTGKLTHTYCDHASTDYKLTYYVTDYLGNRQKVKTWGGVHLEPQAYEMGIAEAYEDFLLMINGGLSQDIYF